MRYKKQIIFVILCIMLLFQSLYCYAYYVSDDTEYVWSENTVETSAGGESGDFLDLSCESAILIEQTTRRNLI